MNYKGFRIFGSANPHVTVYLNDRGEIADYDINSVNFNGAQVIYEADSEWGDYISDFETIEDIKKEIDAIMSNREDES